MNREYPAAEVVEINGEIPNEPIIFAGFVGAGLVGPLSIGHMIAEMNMKEIAYVRSKHIPPSTVFTRLRYPFRIYADDAGKICCYKMLRSSLKWKASCFIHTSFCISFSFCKQYTALYLVH